MTQLSAAAVPFHPAGSPANMSARQNSVVLGNGVASGVDRPLPVNGPSAPKHRKTPELERPLGRASSLLEVVVVTWEEEALVPLAP